MRNIQLFAMVFCFTIWTTAANAAVQVFTCEPEWQALVTEIGGDKVKAYAPATTAMQDPHHIQARPSLIARIRNANLVVCTGADLEIGWLPILLRQSTNRRIQPGTPGYFEAASFVRKLEVPTRLDRAAGDVHPQGNPHIQTDPRNIGLVANALANRLAEIDPGNAATYQQRYAAFMSRWRTAIERWERDAAPLKGMMIIAHHKEWVYMNQWLGIEEIAELEPKPGVQPTVSHLNALLSALEQKPAKLVIRAAYQSPKASEWLAERAPITPVVLAYTIGGTPGAKDLFTLFDDTIARLSHAAGQ